MGVAVSNGGYDCIEYCRDEDIMIYEVLGPYVSP